VRANGGHANHTLFWANLTSGGLARPRHAEPTGVLAAEIAGVFGSLDAFRARLTAAAREQVGSGWAWLSLDRAGALRIEATANEDSLLMDGRLPLVGVDVWEHGRVNTPP
jgi:superoxide dismutase, Fe-Mn family